MLVISAARRFGVWQKEVTQWECFSRITGEKKEKEMQVEKKTSQLNQCFKAFFCSIKEAGSLGLMTSEGFDSSTPD